jgi:hypothetical protein
MRPWHLFRLRGRYGVSGRLHQDDVASGLTHSCREPVPICTRVQVAVRAGQERILDLGAVDGRSEGQDPEGREVLPDGSDEPERVLISSQVQGDQGGQSAVRGHLAQRVRHFLGRRDSSQDAQVRMTGQQVVEQARAFSCGLD